MSITSANSVFMLGIIPIFPVPQRLQGFSADDIFSTDAIEPAEVSMGVDGKLSSGFVFVAIKQSVTLQADSDSNTIFDLWYAAQQVAKDTFNAVGIVSLPSIGTTWALTNGTLTSFAPIPDGGKILKPRKFQITWESVSPAV